MKRFLIVDHDRGFAEATRRCLAARGNEVAVATDGLQCVEELRAMAPAVLVLDPGILWGGGDGVLEWLRSEEPLTPPTIVLVECSDGHRIPDRLLPSINYQCQRPKSLQDLLPFVHQLESIGEKSTSPGDDSSAVNSLTMSSATE